MQVFKNFLKTKCGKIQNVYILNVINIEFNGNILK